MHARSASYKHAPESRGESIPEPSGQLSRLSPLPPALNGQAGPVLHQTHPSAWSFDKIPVHPPGRSPSLPVTAAPAGVQCKLAVGHTDDPLEREADRVAEAVVAAPMRPVAGVPAPLPAQPVIGLDAVDRSLTGSGRPLEPALHREMQQRFGHDFSRVRVHVDAAAEQSARAWSANAYTVGRNIVFGAGRFAPATLDGRRLLAHELTHVVQQSGGGTASSPSPRTFAPPLRISPSGIALHRDTAKDTPRHPLDRPGAKWPFGPVTKLKTVTHDLSAVIAWIKEVEKANGPDKQSVLQRLRRLYYGSASGKKTDDNPGKKTGSSFDRLINDQPGAGDSSDAPLTAGPISTSALDGLFETNVVQLPDGQLLDLSHVLAALDLQDSGVGFKARAAAADSTLNWLGVVTWVGDLAAWLLDFIKADRGLVTPAPKPPDAGAQKVDLLSDMDAQVLAKLTVVPGTIDTVKAEGRIYHDQDANELAMPVSAILEHYYGKGAAAGAAQPTKGKNRFESFVRWAEPPIPHYTAHEDRDGPVVLAPGRDRACNLRRLLETHRLAVCNPWFREERGNRPCFVNTTRTSARWRAGSRSSSQPDW